MAPNARIFWPRGTQQRNLAAHFGVPSVLVAGDDTDAAEASDVAPGMRSVQPLRFDGPVVLEVEVLRTRMTEHALLVPGMELADGRTLRYAAPDFPT